MRFLSLIFLIGGIIGGSTLPVKAQGDEGFTLKIPSATQGDERSRQSSLWVMEVAIKPIRLIYAEVPNKETGKPERELFYYVCYRAINRPIAAPAIRETEPQNQLDEEPGPPYFIPEFTLIAEDSDEQRPYLDTIVPEALAAIQQKERRTYKNSVTIAGPVPEPTTEAPNDENALFGVAIFRGINPKYDRYKLYMNGFSNGYYVDQGPDGEPLLMRKTIEVNFWRPGDEFNPESSEFRFQGEPRWIYRPDAAVAEEMQEVPVSVTPEPSETGPTEIQE